MKVVETVVGPILERRLKNKYLPQELLHVRRDTQHDLDCLVVAPGLIINCKSTSITLVIHRRHDWNNEIKEFVAVSGEFNCRLADFLDCLNVCGITNDFRVQMMERSYNSNNSTELCKAVSAWVDLECDIDMVMDLTTISDVSFIDNNPQDDSSTYLSFMPSPMESIYIGCMGTYTIARSTSKDPLFRPLMGELEVNEDDSKKNMKAFGRAIRLSMTSLLPGDISAIHSDQFIGQDETGTMQSMMGIVDTMSAKTTESSKTSKSKTSGRCPILIIPRSSSPKDPISSSTMSFILSDRSVCPPPNATPTPRENRGRWTLDRKPPIRIIDSGAANLMSDSEWKQITGIILTEQKISAQWLEKLQVYHCSDLVSMLTALSKRIMLIFPLFSDESGASVPTLPAWISRKYPINCIEYNAIYSIVKFVNFNRLTRHNDADTLNGMFSMIESHFVENIEE